MTKSERNQIIKWANTLTDEQLEHETYRAIYDTLGSECEEMYERGWDMVDILEREKYEKWLCKKANLLEKLCDERGIKLWGDYDERSKENENTCSGCIYEDADGSTATISNCVCCSRNVEFAKNDYYRSK